MRLQFMVLGLALIGVGPCSYSKTDDERVYRFDKRYPIYQRFFRDMVDINKHLFTLDTLYVAGVTVPMYIASRKMDHQLHDCFYDGSCHENRHQAPKWLCDLASKGVTVPLIGLTSLSFFAKDPDLKATSSIFWKGMLSIWAVKDIIKVGLKRDCCLRPSCQGFKRKKYYGGFPSGHMAEASYMSLLYGLQMGPKWGLPLAAYALFVFGVSVNCNRHYASQLVAGAGLGAAYALAAHKVVNKRLNDQLVIGLKAGPRGKGLLAEISYQF